MENEFKNSLCETGKKQDSNGRYINEDLLLEFTVQKENIKYNFTILMDGATGLGEYYEIIPDNTPAEWYVKTMSSYMKEIFTKEPNASLEKVVDFCIEQITKDITEFETKKKIKLNEYQKPSAGLSILRDDGNQTQIYLIGDIQSLIKYKDGNVEKPYNPNQVALQNLDNRVIQRMVEIAKTDKCNITDAREKTEIKEMLQINRNKKNIYEKDSYWVCGTTPDSAKNGITLSFNNNDISEILLATDGFEYSILGIDENELFELINKKGVESIAEEIRKVQNDDPNCNRFPRLKKMDDLTVAYYEYKTRKIDNRSYEDER